MEGCEPMSNLDNLISKIRNDSEEESRRIIEAANAEASEVIKKNIEAANIEKERLLNDAVSEAEKKKEQIILSKKLEIRDKKLLAKREMIDKVFEYALAKLNSMPKNEYMKYLHSNLTAMSIDAGEIILPAKYNITINELHALFPDGSMSGIKLYEGERLISGGFILIKGGIEYNRTFEMLLKYYRYELENDIIKILF